ncbi:hypothetical protein Hanom_Chr05g00455971 [Helianthus anomalus]
MALCTGMRLFMVERCPNFETEYVQSSSLANRVQEFSIFENLWVIIIEDMIYLICVKELAELIKLTNTKELELHFLDLEQDPLNVKT